MSHTALHLDARRHARSVQIRAAISFIAITAIHLVATAAELKPGAPLTVSVKGRGGPLTMTFHYCPPGKIRPGMPKPEEPDAPARGGPPGGGSSIAAVLDDAVSMSPFFISETEITIPQFRALLGDDRLGEVVKRFPKLQSTSDLKKTIESGGDFPIYLTSIEDATDFSEALRNGYMSDTDGDAGGIVANQFRVPTHNEWQYACRAVTDVVSERTLPHFNGWPDGVDALDKNTRERCHDEWKKLGRQDREEFRGTQEQVLFILQNSKSGESIPLQILSSFLRVGIGVERDYSLNKPGKVSVVGSSKKANAWGLFDMHENVHEWVIATSSEKADSIVRGLVNGASLSASDRQEKVFLLAGGSFNALMTGSSSGWKTFTIWGAKPSDEKGTLNQFSLDEEGAAHAKTQEYEPGFRVIMQRALSDAWLLTVRQDAILTGKPAPETLGRLKAKRAAAIEVSSASQAREVEARMTFYEGLVQYRLGQRTESSASIRAARKAMPPSSQNRRASSLESALGGGAVASSDRPVASKPVVEEELFLDTLAVLIEQDR
jgi:formylglycine-generating enzyme required for sulfatase activity